VFGFNGLWQLTNNTAADGSEVRDYSGDVGVAKCDPQSIWNPRKKLRLFRRRYIVGILTNKANISI